ncbi:LysM peptidoglycan-binding domain-containing protein [Bacteroides sp. 519]|uniref:LysM peptidoglycan-binding domain-containing protein n=1 Tax=Bacteroides sp. 519 TaxID=2302937 RepID=UPI0013CFEE42|nr:LysM peptidoglycan-binding domain-containing protein [Bacteroides sp. 519]NDV59785.1 LysM peptidoglycan-binding domain-containing protein [Bacteroides sp. 519]
MGLRDKYSKLIKLAGESDISDLSITENNNILYVSGSTTPAVKHELWKIYNEIDPDMRAGDLILNIEEKEGGEAIYEVKSGDSLSKIAKNYPGVTWRSIYEANKDIIKDPNKIFPGQKIRIPG